MSKRAVVGPFGERDFRNEHGLHPVRTARFGAARRIVKRRRFLNERLQPFVEIGQRLRIESGSDLTGIFQFLLPVPAEQQRSKIMARPTRFSKPADDKFLLLIDLYFYPLRRTAGGVFRQIIFGNQSFQAAPFRKLKRFQTIYIQAL